MILEHQLVPYETTVPPKGPYLVFAPHPDDETLGMGGTIALATAKKIPVYVVLMTSGDMGGDPDIRRKEAASAAMILGVERIFHLGMKDRQVHFDPLPYTVLDEIIAMVKPAVIFLPSFQEIHPDHRATTRRVMAYIQKQYSCGQMNDVDIWFYEINRQGEINRLIDVSPAMKTKKQAIDCYGSQLSVLDYKTQCLCLDAARSMTLGNAISYAEGFWVHDPDKGKNPETVYLDHIIHYFKLAT